MENKKDENEEIAEIFKNYMQCFSNKKTKEIVHDKNFDKLTKEHKFWDKQPIVKKENIINPEIKGSIEKKTKSDVQKEPYELPEGFEWVSFDIDIDADIEVIYKFLTNNYVEDDDGNFRFDYHPEFLRWALNPPKKNKDLYFGIKFSKTGNMVGFITGVLIDVKLENKIVNLTEVNFLCVKKEFRKHNIAAILIKELTRRSNIKNVWQGLFTSGTMLPTPFCQTRYYHRNLNSKKLTQINFSYYNSKTSIKSYINNYKLPDECPHDFVPMKIEDIKQVRTLLIEYLKKFKIYQEFSKKDIEHFFLPKKNIVSSYVLKNNGKVTDFFAFYDLSSSILNNKKYNKLYAAYSFYYFNNSISLEDLFLCQLIKAQNEGFDVFNVLDIMDNLEIFDKLKFSKGDGFLQYYLYNWKLESGNIKPNQLGIVLF